MAYKYLNDDGLKAYTKKVKGALKDLHTPIAISTENTTESKAQNVRNIADFVAKAKAAGITDVDGMAVSCIIDNDYSGVVTLYVVNAGGHNYISFMGIQCYDDASDPTVFYVTDEGKYIKNEILTYESSDVVTSLMLTQGARRPIILTPETTEVDEETYQKLLSDDVDVMFKTGDGDSNLCILTYKYDDGDEYSFTFTCLSCEGSSISQTYLYGYEVRITKTGTPHQCRVVNHLVENDFESNLLLDGFIRGYDLFTVLKEINLTGTDAQRKVKLDQFEANWKALTGASDLSGARFVGYIKTPTGYFRTILAFDNLSKTYSGMARDSARNLYEFTIYPSTGTISFHNLFSHLEPITIKTGNTAEDIATNKDAIKAHRYKLEDLGVETSKGYQVSVVVTSDGEEYTGTLNIGTGSLLMGIVTDVNETHHYPFHIETATGIVTFDKTNYFLEKTSNEVTEMLDAIKYSYTPVPLTTTTSTNKTQLDLFLSKVPNAQVMHCTYKNMYAGTLHKINGSWYGVLVGESNTLAGQLSIKLQADGTVVEGTA